MGKHYFKVRHNDEIHNCCFEEDRRIFVLDEKGNPISESEPIAVYCIDMAKEKAMELVESLKKKQQQE